MHLRLCAGLLMLSLEATVGSSPWNSGTPYGAPSQPPPQGGWYGGGHEPAAQPQPNEQLVAHDATPAGMRIHTFGVYRYRVYQVRAAPRPAPHAPGRADCS